MKDDALFEFLPVSGNNPLNPFLFRVMGDGSLVLHVGGEYGGTLNKDLALRLALAILKGTTKICGGGPDGEICTRTVEAETHCPRHGMKTNPCPKHGWVCGKTCGLCENDPVRLARLEGIVEGRARLAGDVQKLLPEVAFRGPTTAGTQLRLLLEIAQLSLTPDEFYKKFGAAFEEPVSP